MLLRRSGVSIRYQPESRLHALRSYVLRQPLRAVRERILVPVLDPIVLALAAAIVPVVELHILEPVWLQVRCEPIRIPDYIVFPDVFVIAGPARPHHGCRAEYGII